MRRPPFTSRPRRCRRRGPPSGAGRSTTPSAGSARWATSAPTPCFPPTSRATASTRTGSARARRRRRRCPGSATKPSTSCRWAATRSWCRRCRPARSARSWSAARTTRRGSGNRPWRTSECWPARCGRVQCSRCGSGRSTATRISSVAPSGRTRRCSGTRCAGWRAARSGT